MGTFKLAVTAPTSIFSHVLNTAAAHGRSFLAWNARSPRLNPPSGMKASGPSKFETRRKDAQMISEFRARMNQTDELLSKLGYGLRELL